MPGFAALEDRVNAAAIKRLANVSAEIVVPGDAAGQTFDVIFDAAYQVIDQATGMQSSAPVITARESDLPGVVVDALVSGDTVALQIRGDTYTVVEPQPDGTGMTLLRLRK